MVEVVGGGCCVRVRVRALPLFFVVWTGGYVVKLPTRPVPGRGGNNGWDAEEEGLWWGATKKACGAHGQIHTTPQNGVGGDVYPKAKAHTFLPPAAQTHPPPFEPTPNHP